jgi:hypothetical protein
MVRSGTVGEMDKVSTTYKNGQSSQFLTIQGLSANEGITWCSKEMHGG